MNGSQIIFNCVTVQPKNMILDATTHLKTAKYEIQNPQLVEQHCFVESFGSSFRVFHLAWSTCCVTKIFGAKTCNETMLHEKLREFVSYFDALANWNRNTVPLKTKFVKKSALESARSTQSRVGEWCFKNSGSRKILVEFHGSRSLVF